MTNVAYCTHRMINPDHLPTPARPRIEIVNHPELDLNVLNPSEIVALWRLLSQADEEISDHFGGVLSRASDEQRRRYELWVDLNRTLRDLPEHDADLGRAVYTAFADSPFTDERVMIADKLGHLTKVDHDSGLALWHRLIRDPEARSDAHEPLGTAYNKAQEAGDHESAEAVLAGEVGLSTAETVDLLSVYERGEQTPTLGEAALHRLTTSPEAP
jgi:hypothetical protein